MLNRNNNGGLMHFPLVIFILIIIISINGCFFSVEYKSDKASLQQIHQISEKCKWDAIETCINKEYKLLSANSEFISKKIETAILREYGTSLNELQRDFENETFDKRLYELLQDQLVIDSIKSNDATKKDKYNIIIGFKDEILAIFSDANKITSNSPSQIGWEEYFNSSANVNLNKKLINNIKNKNIADSMLLYQTISFNDKCEVIEDHNTESLKNVYFRYGINGLKKVDFVTVSYITDYGDIFNTSDYLYLKKTDNYKMILVQSRNVYDSIKQDVIPRIKSIESREELMSLRVSENIVRKSLHFIIINICLIAVILAFSIFYNKNYNMHDL